MTRDVMAEWALTYAEHGWPVIPLHVPTTFGTKTGPDAAECSCGRPPCVCGLDRCECEGKRCTSQGKHPRTANGKDDATTDLDTVARWWDRWPGANIGLRTGDVFDVLDLDGLDAVDLFDLATPDDVAANVLDGPRGFTGRGVHYFVKPTGAGNRTNMIATGSGIDWRGAGGYVVAPPSVHYSGARYEWAPDGLDWTHPLPECPDWLTHLAVTGKPVAHTPAGGARRVLNLDTPRPRATGVAVNVSNSTTAYGRKVLETLAGTMASATTGERNHTLNRCAFIAGQYVAGGEIAEHDARAVLVSGAIGMGLTCHGSTTPPYGNEGDASIASGLTKGMANPKRPTDRVRGVTR